MPGILLANPDAHVIVRRGQRSIHEGYNSILDEAAQIDGLEGLVLLHDDTAIEDTDTEAKLRKALSAPDVAVAGVIGGRDPPAMAWGGGQRGRRGRGNPQGGPDLGSRPPPVATRDGLLPLLA